MKLPIRDRQVMTDIGGYAVYTRTEYVDADGCLVDRANSAAIVRAVNALPGCIEAMELVLDFLEFVHDDLKHRGEAGGHRSKLRAALAAAKGGEPSNH